MCQMFISYNANAHISIKLTYFICVSCCGAGTAADTEKTTDMLSSNLAIFSLNSGRNPRVVMAVNILQDMLFRCVQTGWCSVKPKCIQTPSTFLTLSQFIHYSWDNGNKIWQELRVKLCQNKFILIMSDNFDRKLCNKTWSGQSVKIIFF